ncbi:MAG: hypothetical protein M0P73_09085 [Syntrophobacterales bacterium]|jgi:uncharacterized membrane protein|nr:hypothetical protein [Syntrophobacterales bacterium]
MAAPDRYTSTGSGANRLIPGTTPADNQRPLPPFLARVFARYPGLRRRPHPMLAHFPIVFMLSAGFFSLLYVITGRRAFDATAFYCLGAGLLTMVPAVATGLFTHWLNYPGGADQTVRLEKRLSYSVLVIAALTFIWRWFIPGVLDHLAGPGLLYLFLVLALTPLVTANGYFGGMLTFPLDAEFSPPGRPEQFKEGR